MLNRRELIATGAASAAALALPRMAHAAERADVVIVGAGLSGMHAAELLIDLGMKVIVLDANSRVGGRAPAFSVASGKALLAFAGPAALAALPSPLPRFTPHSIVTASQLEAELTSIRQRGFAVMV